MAGGGRLARVNLVVMNYDVQLNNWLSEWC